MPPRPRETATLSTVTSSAWIPLDRFSSKVAFGVVATATVNYDVEHTFVDIQDASKLPVAAADIFNHESIAAKTSSEDGNYEFLPRAIRLTINSVTGGTAKMIVTHSL